MKKQTAKTETVKAEPVIAEREAFKTETLIGNKKSELQKLKEITVNETVISTDGSRNYKEWKDAGKKINLEKADLCKNDSDDKTATFEIDFTLWAFLYHFWNRLSKPLAPNMMYSATNDLRMYRYFLTRSTASQKAQTYFKAESLKGINSLPYQDAGKYFLQFQA